MARNLVLLGQKVILLSARGDDRAGRALDVIGREAGLDLHHVLVREDMPTSRYVAIHDETGDMAAAINDMSVFDTLEPGAVSLWQSVAAAGSLSAERVSAALVDANLPAEVLAYLISRWGGIPVFADAVSQAKADRLLPVLARLAGLKLNRLEAEQLTGISVVSISDAARAAAWLLDRGVGSVCISMGKEGALFANTAGCAATRYDSPHRHANTTGAGDAMSAVFAWASVEGFSLEQTARLSQAAASLVIESPEPVNRSMTAEVLRQRAEGPGLSVRLIRRS